MKKKYWYVLVGAALIVGAFIAFASGGGKNAADTATVKRGTLVQQISASGKVQSAGRVDMGFERTGRIATINGTVGSAVSAGIIIAALDNRDVVAQVNEALAGLALARAQVGQYQASLEAEQVHLREVKKGSRPEEITLAQTAVDNAKRSVTDAEQNLTQVTSKTETDLKNVYDDTSDVLSDAYAKVNEAVRTDTTVAFRTTTGIFYELTFQPCDQARQTDAVEERYQFDLILPQWQTQVQSISNTSSFAELDKALADAKKNTERAKKFFDTLNSLLTKRCPGRDVPGTSYQTENNAGISLVNAALTAVNAQQQEIASQKKIDDSALQAAQSALTESRNVLISAQSQLALKKAGSTSEQIAIQEAMVKKAQAALESQRAQVAQAAASVESAQAQFEKTLIRSPASGTITKIDIKIGEVASVNVPVVGVVSKVPFEVKSDISEVDVSKLKVGMPAKVTLDAYGSDALFEAKISRVDLAETVVSGVSTYQSIFQFEKEDEAVRLGMTASVDVETARLENVLIIPARAVISDNGKKTVKVIINKGKKDEAIEERIIVTGLRGSDGMIEIKEGLTGGEEIVLSL